MNQETFEKTIERLKKEEGFSPYVYTCPRGFLTIGYGHNLEKRQISEAAADIILREDIIETWLSLRKSYPKLDSLNNARQHVLLDMAFQLGVNGLLNFKKMFKAIEVGDWEGAAIEILNSNYAKQTRERAKRNSDIMRTGKWV